VALDRESGGSQLVDPRGASLNLEHFLAGFAQKVVVMVWMLALVMGRGPRDFHHFHCTHIHQDTESTVNGGDAQPRRQCAGGGPYVGWGHGATRVFERFLYC
jgi:hypothetical protein